MSRRTPFIASFLSISCFLLTTDQVAAQNGGQPVRVQLPTFHVFGISTTVLVPDRGSMVQGGVNRSSRGSHQLGRGNRGYGSSTSAGGVSVSATIIDHSEIDRAVLAEAARRRGATHDVLGRLVSPQRPAVDSTTAKPRMRQAHAVARPNWRALWREK
ncbi:hypothetical protein [Adhaeretor mobilis]|uniref:Uncharacterized protein n=1 Tax=Adhaeretor mobilis TaxID=1930276 RepID=A0A517MQX9_9BACT|nr:hypothetical protein [Adhaeretor mobilis]QDS97282.1 hypothetical protein HG15A2_05430 [Adhaeretor mobilis]